MFALKRVESENYGTLDAFPEILRNGMIYYVGFWLNSGWPEFRGGIRNETFSSNHDMYCASRIPTLLKLMAVYEIKQKYSKSRFFGRGIDWSNSV